VSFPGNPLLAPTQSILRTPAVEKQRVVPSLLFRTVPDEFPDPFILNLCKDVRQGGSQFVSPFFFKRLDEPFPPIYIRDSKYLSFLPVVPLELTDPFQGKNSEYIPSPALVFSPLPPRGPEEEVCKMIVSFMRRFLSPPNRTWAFFAQVFIIFFSLGT